MRSAVRLLPGFLQQPHLMSYVLVFSLQLKDQILYCTVTVLVLPANVPQTFPFGNFNFRVRVFTVNAS